MVIDHPLNSEFVGEHSEICVPEFFRRLLRKAARIPDLRIPSACLYTAEATQILRQRLIYKN